MNSHLFASIVGVATFLALHLILRLVPKAEPPAEGETYPVPSAAQKLRYRLAGLFTVSIGTGVALLFFFVVSPYRIEGAQLQLALMSNGDTLSALFLGLSSAAIVASPICRSMVAPETFGFYIHKDGARFGGADVSIATRRVGNVVFLAALALHLMLSNTYVAADREKIWWSDFLELGRNEVAWSEVKELRIVALRKPPVGAEKEDPYLAWVLEDGRRVTAKEGNSSTGGLALEEIEAAIRFTAATGKPVRKVRRDE